MKSLHLAAALAAVLASPADASIRALIPRETRAFIYALDQITPRPTPAPLPPRHLAHRPRQRDDDESTSEIETAWVAPDNICGYINGRPGASFYCPANYDCLFFTASATLTGAVACCNADACNLRITCMDYDQVVSSSQCNDACMVDAFTLKCTNTRLPYCNTASFSSNIFDFWCNDVSISTVQEAFTTYTGQTSDREFSPLPLTTSVSTTPLPGPTGPDDQGDDDPDDGGDGGGDGGDGGDGEGGDGDGGKKKGSNAGAIAGGVVGGVAAVGLIGLGALFLIRKKKAQKSDPSTPATIAAAPAMPPQHPGQPGQPQAGFAPGQPPAAFIPQQHQQQHQSMYDPNFAAAGGFKQELPTYYNNNLAPPAQTPGQSPAQNLSPISPERNGSTSPSVSADAQGRQSTLISSPAMSQVSNFAPYPQQPGQVQMQGQPMMQQQQPPQGMQPGMQQPGYPLQQGSPVVQQQQQAVAGQAVAAQQPQHHRGEMAELA